MIRIVILVVALVAGGAAAWMAVAMRSAPAVVTEIAAVAPAAKVAVTEVLIAARELSPGEVLTADAMRWQAWPEGAINAAYVSRAADPGAAERLAGSVARLRIVEGEPVVESKLSARGSGFMSSQLPAGKRAVAVRISAETTAGGFILPNDRVDILHTTPPRNDSPMPRSRTLLRNVRVLAIDQKVDERVKDDKTKSSPTAVGKTATVELDPELAEVLAAAEASGVLSLALRSAADYAEGPSLVRHETRSQPTVIVIRGPGAGVGAAK
jgi:pilus assembly protein CpaB